MRVVLTLPVFFVAALTLSAQSPTNTKPQPPAAPVGARNAINKPPTLDLPVRKVVLYKNGVGYFEHAGEISGNQRVAIDFTSSQLNDVLQSLTVLDEGGGRIAGVDYNSTTPIEQQLRTLALGLKDYPATIAVYQAIRGQRVEISGAGTSYSGRLVNIEFRKETDKNGVTSEDHYFLLVETDSGALRTAELSDAVQVRMLDAGLQKQFDEYLEIVGSAQNQQLRHVTLDALGSGSRALRVSYISEVPVWKSTYRIVFPQETNGKATVQGWAVVDNTIGADWDNVQLSLVAGAPQSFIQPLSQPLYTNRPTIPIATAALSTPEIHEAAEFQAGEGALSGIVTDATGAVIPNATVTVTASNTGAATSLQTSSDGRFTVSSLASGMYALSVSAPGFQRFTEQNVAVNASSTAVVNVSLNVGAATQTVMVSADAVALSAPAPAAKMRGYAGSGGGIGAGYGVGGGVYRVSDAMNQSDVSASSFDDFFKYSLAQPVTIHKNESAMVPILQQDLLAEHVTLWSSRDPHPLRAVWLENTSKLTLDAGSFSIFESGEFAGEGLLDPIHPGEKRLLSYAADQAVKVRQNSSDTTRVLHHIAIHKGIVVQTTGEVITSTYTVTNAADEKRTVLVEHTRSNDATLDPELKPAETTASGYRFRVAVEPHQSTDFHVTERATLSETVDINQRGDQDEFIVSISKYTPELEQKLRPLIDAQTALSGIDDKINQNDANQKQLDADEARDRENLTALKGNDAAKRFVEELNQAEDAIAAARNERADLDKQHDAAQQHLDDIIAALSFDTDLDIKM
jgi:Carboxypeptidase regulatory-like domain